MDTSDFGASRSGPPARTVHAASLIVFYLGASFFVHSLWLLHGTKRFNSGSRGTLQQLLEGGAERPFSARLLIPWLAHLTSGWVPDRVGERAAHHPRVAHALTLFHVDSSLAPELLSCLVLTGLCLIAWLIVLRRLCSDLYPSLPPVLLDLVPAIALLGLPMIFVQGGRFVYDLPSLLLATIGLVCIERQRWRWLALVVFVGALNKESIAVVIAVFAVSEFKRSDRRTFVVALARLVACFAVARIVAIELSEPVLVSAAHGHYLRNYLARNLADFWKSGILLRYETMSALVVWALLLGARWRHKPLFLRQAFLCSSIVLGILYLIAGRWGEVRVFYEAYPALALLVQDSAWRVTMGDDAVNGWMIAAESSSKPRASVLPEIVALWIVGGSLLYAGVTAWIVQTGS